MSADLTNFVTTGANDSLLFQINEDLLENIIFCGRLKTSDVAAYRLTCKRIYVHVEEVFQRYAERFGYEHNSAIIPFNFTEQNAYKLLEAKFKIGVEKAFENGKATRKIDSCAPTTTENGTKINVNGTFFYVARIIRSLQFCENTAMADADTKRVFPSSQKFDISWQFLCFKKSVNETLKDTIFELNDIYSRLSQATSILNAVPHNYKLLGLPFLMHYFDGSIIDRMVLSNYKNLQIQSDKKYEHELFCVMAKCSTIAFYHFLMLDMNPNIKNEEGRNLFEECVSCQGAGATIKMQALLLTNVTIYDSDSNTPSVLELSLNANQDPKKFQLLLNAPQITFKHLEDISQTILEKNRIDFLRDSLQEQERKMGILKSFLFAMTKRFFEEDCLKKIQPRFEQDIYFYRDLYHNSASAMTFYLRFLSIYCKDIFSFIDIKKDVAAAFSQKIYFLLEQWGEFHSKQYTYRDGSSLLHFLCSVKTCPTSVIEILTSTLKNINIKDKDQQTPLHIAVASNNIPVIEYLCKKGANPYTCNGNNETPLSIAQKNGDSNLLEALGIYEQVRQRIKP